MLRVMCELRRDQQLDVGRRMKVDREPWGMASWNALDKPTRERLATTRETYNVLGHHWPACAEFGCDALATDMGDDGEFCCSEHVKP
jgi:hypothetical protein